MTKDYAKKNLYPQSQHRRLPKFNGPGTIGLLLGLIVAGILYWQFQTPKTTKPNSIANAKKDQKLPQTKVKSRFDFYTLLPNLQETVKEPIVEKPLSPPSSVPIPTPPPKVVQPIPVQTAIAPTVKTQLQPKPKLEQFVLQAGVFTQSQPADELKAQLAMNGVEAHINFQPHAPHNQYRVYIGPFANRAQALAYQQQLKQQGLHSLIIKSSV